VRFVPIISQPPIKRALDPWRRTSGVGEEEKGEKKRITSHGSLTDSGPTSSIHRTFGGEKGKRGGEKCGNLPRLGRHRRRNHSGAHEQENTPLPSSCSRRTPSVDKRKRMRKKKRKKKRGGLLRAIFDFARLSRSATEKERGGRVLPFFMFLRGLQGHRPTARSDRSVGGGKKGKRRLDARIKPIT